jgi:outer membrane protein insertion porin family
MDYIAAMPRRRNRPELPRIEGIEASFAEVRLTPGARSLMTLFPRRCRFVGLLLMVVPCLALPVAGQEADFGQPITSIEVVGAVTVGARQVESWAGLEAGQTLTSDLAAAAVRRLFATKKFAEVYVYAQRVEGGQKLIVNLREFPRIRSVRFVGNKKISEKDLREAFPVTVGQFANPAAIQRDLQPLRDLYLEKGYRNAKLDTDASVIDANNMEDLVVTFDEGKKVKIKSITFEGNQVLSDDNLRGAMKQGSSGFLKSGTFKTQQFEEDRDRLVTHFRDNGFLDGTVNDVELKDRADGENLDVVIHVTEGPRYTVGDVNWSGNKVHDDVRVASRIFLRKGDIFREKDYLRTLESVQTLYADEGYIYVAVEPQREIVERQVNVALSIFEGDPAKVHDIRVTGNTKTYDEVLLRELRIFPGDVFSRSRIEASVRDAMQLGYFEQVQPDFKAVENTGDLDLVFDVKERQTGQFMFGAAYSAETSVSGFIQVQESNFQGKGQTVGVTWQFGSRRRYVDLSFTEPWFLGRPLLFGADVFDRYQYNYDDFYESRVRGFSLRTGARIPGTRYSRVGLRYELSQQRLSNFSPAYVSYLDQLEESLGTSGLPFERLDEVDWPELKSSLRFTYTRNSTDNPFFPTAGANTTYSFDLAGGPLGGEIDYHEHQLNSSHFQRLPGGFALHLRAMFGLIIGTDGVDNVPDYEKYRLGGNRLYPLRGYQDREVVPRGNPTFIGGRCYTIFNTEVLYPLSRAVQLLTFLDMGDTWNSFSEANLAHLRKGAGFGIRVEVPMMGKIGFDYGYGFDKLGGAGWEPHFNFGTMF